METFSTMKAQETKKILYVCFYMLFVYVNKDARISDVLFRREEQRPGLRYQTATAKSKRFSRSGDRGRLGRVRRALQVVTR